MLMSFPLPLQAVLIAICFAYSYIICLRVPFGLYMSSSFFCLFPLLQD